MRTLPSLLFSASLLAACDASSHAHTDAGVDAAPQPVTILCSDPRSDGWALPIEKHTAGGLTVSLVGGTPSPPIIGVDGWQLAVRDGAGTVDGLTITATPWMPDHGHGTSIRPKVTAQGGGAYAIDTLYFFMAGVWQTTLALERAGTTEEVVFTLCLAEG